MILIDGEEYNATVETLTRKAEFLDKYAQRTEDGVLQREIIGVYFNYQLTFGYAPPDEYQRLWDKLTEKEGGEPRAIFHHRINSLFMKRRP